MTASRVVVETEVRPTEDKNRVLKAVLRIIEPGNIKEETLGDSLYIIVESDKISSLTRLYYMLRAERILDAARSAMKKGLQGGRLVFYLHKQALYAGKLSFVSSDHESPLGAIKVSIEHDNPRSVIDWLAPPTSKGKPVFERPAPD